MQRKKKPEQQQEEQPPKIIKEKKPKSDKHMIKEDPSSSVKIDQANSFVLGQADTKVYCIKFDNQDKYLACACKNGQIRIYNVQKRKLAQTIYANQKADNHKPIPYSYVVWRPTAPQFKTKNIFVTTNIEGEVQHFHLLSGKCLGTLKDDGSELYCLDYNADASKFAVCGQNPIIKIYDEEKRVLDFKLGLEQTQPPPHKNRVYQVKYHKGSNPNQLLSGGWDYIVLMWDLRDRKPVNYINGPKITGDGIDIKEYLGEYKIMTASNSDQNQLQIWDLRTCKLYNTIDWDSQLKTSNEPCQLYCGQFSKQPDEATLILAGGSGARECKLFDTEAMDKAVVSIYDISRDIYTVDFANKEKRFALSGGDGFIRVFSWT